MCKKLFGGSIMRLDGFGLFVEDLGVMIPFYRDVLGFEIKEKPEDGNVYMGTEDVLYCRS